MMKFETWIGLVLLLLCGCTQSPKTKLSLPHIDQFETIPDGLDLQAGAPQFKLVAFLSGDCYECITDLNKWQHFNDSIGVSDKVALRFYIYSYDFDRFKTLIQSHEDLQIPLLLDVNNIIYNEYLIPLGLENDKVAYLLNETNEVVVKGYPFYDRDILDQYVSALSEAKLLE